MALAQSNGMLGWMESDALVRWVQLLRQTAQPVTNTSEPALPGGSGAAFALAVTGGAGAAPLPLPFGDAGLWWALVDSAAAAQVETIVTVDGDGPLLAEDRYLAIEVWTESELSALHALFDLAITHRRGDWLMRAERARDWHLRHTQPDHATARPWAIHGVLLGRTAETQHYAEMLLHNCMAMTGQPDANSAWVLMDAAKFLERAIDQ